MTKRSVFLGFWLSLPIWAGAADWPQFMANSEHNSCVAEEEIRPPLGLIAQVQVDDMILSSPVVVRGKAYVVDRMGTAYGIDPDAGKVVWKRNPDGQSAMGGNASTPCATGGLSIVTIVSGIYVRDAKTGEMLWKDSMGWPPRNCVNAVPSNGRPFVNPLLGLIQCFEPVKQPEKQ